MIKQKKGIGTWILVLIIIILVIIGVGVYFWISGDNDSEISSGDDRSAREDTSTSTENIPDTIGKTPTPPVLPS